MLVLNFVAAKIRGTASKPATYIAKMCRGAPAAEFRPCFLEVGNFYDALKGFAQQFVCERPRRQFSFEFHHFEVFVRKSSQRASMIEL